MDPVFLWASSCGENSQFFLQRKNQCKVKTNILHKPMKFYHGSQLGEGVDWEEINDGQSELRDISKKYTRPKIPLLPTSTLHPFLYRQGACRRKKLNHVTTYIFTITIWFYGLHIKNNWARTKGLTPKARKQNKACIILRLLLLLRFTFLNILFWSSRKVTGSYSSTRVAVCIPFTPFLLPLATYQSQKVGKMTLIQSNNFIQISPVFWVDLHV